MSAVKAWTDEDGIELRMERDRTTGKIKVSIVNTVDDTETSCVIASFRTKRFVELMLSQNCSHHWPNIEADADGFDTRHSTGAVIGHPENCPGGCRGTGVISASALARRGCLGGMSESMHQRFYVSEDGEVWDQNGDGPTTVIDGPDEVAGRLNGLERKNAELFAALKTLDASDQCIGNCAKGNGKVTALCHRHTVIAKALWRGRSGDRKPTELRNTLGGLMEYMKDPK